MLQYGIIAPSVSPYASSITLVTKRDKTKRFCVDYRKLNEIITPDVHPLPLIETILDKLSKAKYYSSVHPDGQVHPVQYFSRALRAHERNYTVSELECLAIVESIDKFRIYLTGIKFTIYTDHQALQWFKTIKNPSGRLFRWSLRLSTYNYEIHYLKGSQQYEADLLSRNPFVGFISADIIKQHQPTESPFNIDTNGLHTITRKGVTKIIIPETLQHTLMNKVHQEYNHPGISQMIRIITTQYYWKGISKYIEKNFRLCHTCQIIKRPKGKPYGALGQIPPPQQPFDLVSIDTIAGFSKYGHSKTYLHVIVDHLTRYAWAFPSMSTSTLTYIQTLKTVLQQGSPKPLRTHLNPYPEINIAREIARSRTQNKHKKDKETFDKQHRTPHFEVNDLVLVKNYRHHDTGKLAPYFTGPYTIIEIISPNVVRIDRPNQPLNRDSDPIHVNKLKYYTENVLYITPPQPRFVQNRQRLSQDGWVFGHGLDDDALAILASAKTYIYRYFLGVELRSEDLVWRRTLSRSTFSLNLLQISPEKSPDGLERAIRHFCLQPQWWRHVGGLARAETRLSTRPFRPWRCRPAVASRCRGMNHGA
ncbi:hypothetical protein LAZ67_10000400 [Cordylochernes scorpioides]|uniref:RNA-directed DNA polymerase n=1 Tax=Cordylochernes scorpioides TaxID=51811 RepID=A0ABY6KYF8_9ARAC|nr:hypothetical protein LAZ67_10000400 [Cordylochernes scorpioides]